MRKQKESSRQYFETEKDQVLRQTGEANKVMQIM